MKNAGFPTNLRLKQEVLCIFFKDKNIGLFVLIFFNLVNRREILTIQIIFFSVFDR